MVTLSNEGQSSGGLYKRLLENAYHPSGSMPKYKLRKVSAVRDFPSGCGPNVPSVNLRPEENIIVPAGGDSVGYVVEANSEENFVIQTESRSLEAVNVGKEVEACWGRVSAIRGFPPLCGTNALQEFKYEGRRVIYGNMSLVEDENLEVKCEVIERLNYGVETGLLGQPSLCDVENGTLGETSVACTEGIPLTETVIAEAEELGGLPGGEFEKGELKELDPEQMEESDTLIRKSSDDMREVARKEIVLHPQDNSNKSRPSENVLATVGPVAREIVHGLMAAPYCPWAQGKSALTSSLGRKSESKVKKDLTGWRERPKAVAHEFEKGGLKELDPERIEEFDTLISKSSEDTREVAGNEIVLYPQDNNNKSRPSENVLGTVGPVAREIVHGLMAVPYCPWGRGKSALTSSLGRTSESKVKKDYFGWQKRSKPVAKKSIPEADSSGRSTRKKKSFYLDKTVDESPGAMIVKDEGECGALYAEPLGASPFPSSSPSPAHGKCNFDVSLPPFGPNCSSHGDARSRVRETLRLFTTICRKLLQGEEAKSGPEEEGRPRQSDKCLRIDLQAAKMIKSKKKEVNTGHRIGAVPGVEVGDEFQYRVELAIVGIHRLYQGGIDYLKHDGSLLATSIVASGAYADDMENADVLIYSGQGGNVVGKNKQPEDQKLVKGNLALKNSISIKNPVRVIRGSKEIKASDFSDARDKVVMTYVYDGLYTVERYWSEIGKHGKMVFKFELSRIRGQPELARKEVKLSKKSKIRRGVCVNDISGGNESFPICAVNTTDNEKPPTFTYIAKIMYPDWFHQSPPKGCDCTGRCSDSRKCSCAVKNGGEIPYNFNGAIVEAKALVYECGPSCKCPPSCYNRVSQRGTKIKLEIFKTESRGWGVRSLSFIPSGSFICEYAGELLEDQEAEKRTGNDEYLFDIGKNCNDCSSKPDVEVESVDVTEEGGYTIDAAQYGNIGRFINHSCSPNLYAQNVLYDHEDKRMPHIMLFAAENIPALQELTYHYNYSVDQVRDSNGNIKMKSCYCGSAECTGRMY